MSKVAGVNQEISGSRGVDLLQRSVQGCGHVGIGWLVESDVAVADLNEAEVRLAGGVTGSGEHARHGNAAGKTPDEPRACPCHALQKSAPVDAVVAGVNL